MNTIRHWYFYMNPLIRFKRIGVQSVLQDGGLIRFGTKRSYLVDKINVQNNRGGTILCIVIFVGFESKPLPHPYPSFLRLSNEPAPNLTKAIASGFDCLADAPSVMNELWNKPRNKLPLSGIMAQRFGFSICLILIPVEQDNDDSHINYYNKL
ncbi:uncharacterized protein LOC134204530 [Armigeres subalbatus]|uniref:uncharacterized protein LOC134204530 n=1 Tax=Armigeres subalbatus TaxID=124917 RepID=UPI002ED404C5